MTQSAPKPLVLSPLRKGLTYTFNDYDRDGKPQWLIHDPGRNKFFIIGWKEYEILNRWHLLDPLAIVNSVNSETSMQIDLSDIENFSEFLTRHFLVEQSAAQIQKQALDQNLFKEDNLISWLIHHYLFFRIPLWYPDKFLARTAWIPKLVFNRYTGYLMIALAMIALFQLSLRWEIFTHSFSEIFSWKGLFYYLIAFTICKFFHELGHAYMCRGYGIPVASMGIAFLVFWPVLYTDTTLSWSLNSKKRMYIALAGMWVETYVTIIAALIWCNIHNNTLQSITYLIITVNWVASLLINVSPFMRFDGYYVLADFLKMPNLQPRAFALARWQIRQWLFYWDEPPPEIFTKKMRYFLVIYSIVTWIYRLVLYLGIAVLVYHFFIKIVGILLFAIEIFYFILNPLIAEIKVWVYYKEKFSFNLHSKLTLFFTILACLIFFLPISEAVKLPATLSYAHQFLFANNEGILETPLPAPGTHIKKGEIITRIISPEINQSLLQIELEYQKNLSELRRSELNPTYREQQAILISNLKKLISEHQKLKASQEKLILRAPFDGVLIDTAQDLKAGTVVSKGEWLGDLINPAVLQVEAFVSQIDIGRVNPKLKGYFHPYDLSQADVPVSVQSIEPLNITELQCKYATQINAAKNENVIVETPCYHASDFGGAIATYLTDKGEYVPIESEYRVILTTHQAVKLSRVERGTVILRSKSSTIASRLIYHLKSLWIAQSSF